MQEFQIIRIWQFLIVVSVYDGYSSKQKWKISETRPQQLSIYLAENAVATGRRCLFHVHEYIFTLSPGISTPEMIVRWAIIWGWGVLIVPSKYIIAYWMAYQPLNK